MVNRGSVSGMMASRERWSSGAKVKPKGILVHLSFGIKRWAWFQGILDQFLVKAIIVARAIDKFIDF